MQDAEDDGATDAEGEHEGELADEPAAHAGFGDDEGFGETVARTVGDEGEEVVVDSVAFEHEVDAEDKGGDEVEEVAEPEGSACEDVLRGGCEGCLALCGERVDAEFVCHGQVFELGNEAWDARGKVGSKVLNVFCYGRKTYIEEDGKSSEDGEDEGHDCDRARGRVFADADPHDALHDGAEDDGEEGADIDDFEDLAEAPGEREAESKREGKEDVAADRGDLRGAIVSGIGVVGLQGQRARSLVGL